MEISIAQANETQSNETQPNKNHLKDLPDRRSERSYCFQPDCTHPENDREADRCQNCGADLLLNGRYRGVEFLGQGGFGRTFKAIDQSQPSQPYCAVKQFFPQQRGLHNQTRAAKLFEQEAKRLEELGKHPQIPTLFDSFEHEQCHYLVQEFIAGRNLAQELVETGTFDEAQIRQLLRDVVTVLQFVHQHHVIHRDIKPENIIRRHASVESANNTDAPQQSDLVLVDFGAAKHTTASTWYKTGTMIGSAAYVAPEQLRGKAEFSSDFYSLGVTCIHLLTGIPPFDLFDGGQEGWIWEICLDMSVSASLRYILNKMLQGAVKRRYRSAKSIVRDLNAPSFLALLPWPKWWVGPYRVAEWIILATVLIGTGALASQVLMRSRTPQIASQPIVISPQAEQTYSQPSYTNPSQPQAQLVSHRSPPADFGGLYAQMDGQELTFPLKHTDVMAKVSGNLSRVEVRQTFTNPYDRPLEAVYQFPLPDNAAVDDMEIRMGELLIRGLIKEREEAKQIYETAKQAGKTAGLLEQERPNLFTQSVANIRPGETIEVIIRYTNSLDFEGGEYEFAFPMVVGPRYIPGDLIDAEGNTNQVIDAANVTPPTLPPEVRSGHDIGITIDLDAGVPIQQVTSPSHTIKLLQDQDLVQIQLANQKTIPNKDLILRYQVAGDNTQATVLAQADDRGGHFASYLIPAVDYDPNQIVPKDIVFLMDTSGSQAGEPIEQSKELMRQFLHRLNPNDTFTIINFSNTATTLSDEPLVNTDANRRKAMTYVNRLQADGGTELMNGINTVLDFPAAPEGRVRSIVLLTDGLIGNDETIIGAIRDRLQRGNRVHTFGVGPSTNRFLINRLAEVGHGTSEILAPTEPAEKVADKFAQNISNPVLTNVEVAWDGTGKAPDLYPKHLPDLFANQPLVLHGRKADRTSGKLMITGTIAGGRPYRQVLDVTFEPDQGNPAIAQLWGRARIQELMNQMYNQETDTGIEAVTQTALAYRLLSKYTAFVAVTEEVRVDPNEPKLQQDVPLDMPEGMQLPGTVGGTVPAQNPIPYSTPEPGEILGNLAAVLVLILLIGRKQLWPLVLQVVLRRPITVAIESEHELENAEESVNVR